MPRPTARYQAVFLDRDGVLNENRTDHVKHWSEFRFLPGAPEAVARLTRAGMRVFVVTNQAVISRGLVARTTLDDLHQRMQQALAAHGGHVEAIAYCPHLPEQGCGCRKPRPGLLTALAHTHGLDLARCLVIGDALSDLEAGWAAGCETLLVLSGRGREQHALAAMKRRAPAYMLAPDLAAAVELALRSPRRVATAVAGAAKTFSEEQPA